jgi:hypothetical protein
MMSVYTPAQRCLIGSRFEQEDTRNPPSRWREWMLQLYNLIVVHLYVKEDMETTVSELSLFLRLASGFGL